MKQLELTTNKRILIVEFIEIPEVYKFHKGFLFFKFKKENEYNDGAINVGFEKIKEICKGSDLTEDIANVIVEKKQVFDTPAVFFFKNYKHYIRDCITALESFISAIESKQKENGIAIDLSKSLIFEIL